MLELISILVAIQLSGNKILSFKSDNQDVVNILNTNTSRSLEFMILVRSLDYNLICLSGGNIY